MIGQKTREEEVLAGHFNQSLPALNQMPEEPSGLGLLCALTAHTRA